MSMKERAVVNLKRRLRWWSCDDRSKIRMLIAQRGAQLSTIDNVVTEGRIGRLRKRFVGVRRNAKHTCTEQMLLYSSNERHKRMDNDDNE